VASRRGLGQTADHRVAAEHVVDAIDLLEGIGDRGAPAGDLLEGARHGQTEEAATQVFSSVI